MEFEKWEGPGIINPMSDVEGKEKVVRRSLSPFLSLVHVESLGTRLLLIHKNITQWND